MKKLDRTKRTPTAVELAEAIDDAISKTGEFNYHSAEHSLVVIKEMAQAFLSVSNSNKTD